MEVREEAHHKAPEVAKLSRDARVPMRLSVTVVARARKTRVERLDAAHFCVAVTAPAHKGRANAAVLAALAEYFQVPRPRVRIVRGMTSRHKIVEIE